jgi:cell division protein FtsL
VIRLNLILLMAVVASACYLVRTQYESRRLYAELEMAGKQQARLETENERLQVEKRGQATPLRVERLAKEKLQMRTVTPAITQYVSTGRDSAEARLGSPQVLGEVDPGPALTRSPGSWVARP